MVTLEANRKFQVRLEITNQEFRTYLDVLKTNVNREHNGDNQGNGDMSDTDQSHRRNDNGNITGTNHTFI